MRKTLLAIMLIVPILYGCSFMGTRKKEEPPVIPIGTEVKVDPRVLEPCKPLILLAPSKGSSETDHYDILINLRVNTEIYRDCSKRQEDGISLIKQFSNKKETK